MRRPVIAVTSDRRSSGLKPTSTFLVPPDPSPEPEWLAWVARSADGLLLTGGVADLHPSHYGEEVLGRLEGVDEARTALALGLARLALATDLPVLGLCGGFQTLAVAAGGRLWQDILTFIPGASEHEQPTDPSTPWHEVALSGRLAALYGADRVMVNSTHHQAVRDPGAFVVTGRAPDGVVEAIEHPDHPFAVGVTWHPELLALTQGSSALAPLIGLIQASSKK